MNRRLDHNRVMKCDFLVESYETERIKVLSVWSEFKDEDLPVRPKQDDPRGRSVHEHMVHQCVSAPTIYAYASVDALLIGESRGGEKSRLPGTAGKVVTERPR
jgi:hypothetical protein